MLIFGLVVIIAILYIFFYLAGTEHVGITTLLTDLTGTCKGEMGYSCYSAYMTPQGNLTVEGTFNQSTFANLSAEGAVVTGFRCVNATGVGTNITKMMPISQSFNATVPCGTGGIAVYQETVHGGRGTYVTTNREFGGTIYLEYSTASGGGGQLPIAYVVLSHAGS
jgi:hypothetical protein